MTGRFFIQRCPQNGKGNTDVMVNMQKSSLLAGVFCNTVCNALSSFCNCQTLKPLWSPQLPTTVDWAPPNASACSYWSSSKNFQFTLGRSIDTKIIFLRLSCGVHSWELKKMQTLAIQQSAHLISGILLQINIGLGRIKYNEYHHKWSNMRHLQN